MPSLSYQLVSLLSHQLLERPLLKQPNVQPSIFCPKGNHPTSVQPLIACVAILYEIVSCKSQCNTSCFQAGLHLTLHPLFHFSFQAVADF